MTNTFPNARGPGRIPIVVEDTTFVASTRNSILEASGFSPDGNASGATLTVTVSGLYGNTADGNAVGATKVVTASLIAGAAEVFFFAPGATVTATASISPGSVHTRPVDGGFIYEFSPSEVHSLVYQSVDYDSIYSRGDRIANGLLQGGHYGWSFVFSPGFEGYDYTYSANGPSASGTTPGAAFWFSTVGGEGLDIRGFTLIGGDHINSFENFWSFRGGISPGNYALTSYFNFDAFNPNQETLIMAPAYTASFYYSTFEDDPRYHVQYPHYEFIYVSGPRPDTRWTNEVHLKIAHSNLDGGDRRPTAPASKRVAFTSSSHWQYVVGASNTTPQDGFFDGQWEFETSKKTVGPGSISNVNTPVSTVGAWFQFVFPRPVKPKHLLFINWNNQKETYTGANPDTYGKWHWEYSADSGASWTSIGSIWSFRENCVYMVAPRGSANFGLPPMTDDGATHWRMVLDQGPAFGLGKNVYQILFDLDDITGLAPPFVVDFTDDVDGVPVVVTIGPPGSPYILALSDGSSDGLTFTVQNTPNPVLTVAFTDEGQFDTWSDLYPSQVVQTVVVTTGRE